MDLNNENNNLTEKEESIIKNICYNNETGRLLLIDNRNNHFLCDIFGRKKPNFLPTISGISNAFERNYNPLTSRESKPKKILEEIYSPKVKSIIQKNYIDYYPTTRKLEGYSIFPRPVVPPYSNISSYKKIKNNKEKLIKCLNEYFSNEKNKKDVTKENDNNGLSYITYDINEYDSLKVDSEHILKLIEDTFNNYKEKYKYKLNTLKKEPLIKALTKFKNYILDNKDIKIINGRELKKYNLKIKEKYNIIKSIIHKRNLTNDIKYRNILKLKGKSTFANKIKKIKINLLQKNKYNKNKFDSLNTISSSRDLTFGKKIKMDFGIFSYEEEAKKKEKKLKLIEEYTKKIENEIKDPNNEISDIIVNNDEPKINEENNLNDEIKENDISFISLISENEKINCNKNNYKIKNMNKLIIINENEKNLLKGFNREEPQRDKYIIKLTKPKLKTNGQHFIEDIEILKKTNPIAYKMEDKKEERSLKQLEKKMKALRINANNIMKNKIINNNN